MADATGVIAVPELTDLIPFDPVLPSEAPDGMGFGLGELIPLLSTQYATIPEWWSKARDLQLAALTRKTDPLKIAVNTFIAKACTVPFNVVPKDESVPQHVDLAETMQAALMENSGLRRGFYEEFKRFIWDYLTTDNGAFAIILARGLISAPIVGRPAGIMHLASSRCSRTSNPEYPVVYMHTDNKRYRIHHARLISMVNLPSSEPEMRGVGLCPVSLCLDGASELLDISQYMKEKLGSRPPRSILYAKTGATVDQIENAVKVYELKMLQEGLTRFAKTLLLAPKLPGGKLELDTIDLASLPDHFDRQSVTLLDMALIAASFGLDLRDLAYAFGISGQTKADAEIQHIKGLGKGVATFTEEFARKLTSAFLPSTLDAVFNFIDDSQDEQAARIRSLRSTARSRDVMAGVTTTRVVRVQMLREEELTRADFEEMELHDGRLPDGTSVDSLFFSSDPVYSSLLIFDVDDPTDLNTNDPAAMDEQIRTNLQSAWQRLEETTNLKERKKIRQVIGALVWLQSHYQGLIDQQKQQAQQMEQLQAQAEMGVMLRGGKAQGSPEPGSMANSVAGNASKNGLPQPKVAQQGGKPGGQNGNNQNPTVRTQKGRIRNRTRATIPRP